MTVLIYGGQNQCCQLDDFVATFSNFLDPVCDFILKKRLATHLATLQVIGEDMENPLEIGGAVFPF